MQYDNAARKSPLADPTRSIHLVYSRDWQQRPQPGARPISSPQPAPSRKGRRVRESHAMATLGLAAAAFSGPLVWFGHAMLKWMHVL